MSDPAKMPPPRRPRESIPSETTRAGPPVGASSALLVCARTLALPIAVAALLVSAGLAFSLGAMASAIVLRDVGAISSSGAVPSVHPIGSVDAVNAAVVRSARRIDLPTTTEGAFAETLENLDGGSSGAVTSNETRSKFLMPAIYYDGKNASSASHDVLLDGSGSDGSTENMRNEARDTEQRPDARIPSGHHLLVDMKGVDSEFLGSEERLAGAMFSLANKTDRALLSYHCHSLAPVSISCAGVMVGSRVSDHGLMSCNDYDESLPNRVHG